MSSDTNSAPAPQTKSAPWFCYPTACILRMERSRAPGLFCCRGHASAAAGLGRGAAAFSAGRAAAFPGFPFQVWPRRGRGADQRLAACGADFSASHAPGNPGLTSGGRFQLAQICRASLCRSALAAQTSGSEPEMLAAAAQAAPRKVGAGPAATGQCAACRRKHLPSSRFVCLMMRPSTAGAYIYAWQSLNASVMNTCNHLLAVRSHTTDRIYILRTLQKAPNYLPSRPVN